MPVMALNLENSPFSHREKVRMKGSNNALFPVLILLTPTLSSRRGRFFP
jgi:hypothetical protein